MIRILSLGLLLVAPQPRESTPNILFIAIDDLRPELGCYGADAAISPNIDRLAARGVVFRRAYCQVPVCCPSRLSLLTGLRPTRTRFRDNRARKAKDAPDVPSLPMHLRKHGYVTISNGKIYHAPDDDLEAWTGRPWVPRGDWAGRKVYRIAYLDPRNKEIARRNKGNGPAFESVDVDDARYPDGKIADRTVADLERLKDAGKPFFLAAGFTKPHLPFNCPSRYWERHEGKAFWATGSAPKDAPREALHDFPELRKYTNVPRRGAVENGLAAKLVRGYTVCVTATDAQVGKVLDALDRLDLRKNTIVVLWGDHGWNLGDHGMWAKACLFETALRAPLLFAGPGVPEGRATGALVEFVDVYPTLCDLAGVKAPPHLEGRSLRRLMRHPEAAWKKAAFSRFRDGESVKTDRYRYTEWSDAPGRITARMLFDHEKDPGETVNVAGRPEYAEAVEELSSLFPE